MNRTSKKIFDTYELSTFLWGKKYSKRVPDAYYSRTLRLVKSKTIPSFKLGPCWYVKVADAWKWSEGNS